MITKKWLISAGTDYEITDTFVYTVTNKTGDPSYGDISNIADIVENKGLQCYELTEME
ncbi:hypothetical protein [Limosilactobacillus vaginalis]|uniref:hypothetical protein n=1 Tax=Limosilactobacillus vaginalis TaxID=1633 RepID=UPI0022E28961|nr:hypothetical protein [Limosilactobacillus vaginalis]